MACSLFYLSSCSSSCIRVASRSLLHGGLACSLQIQWNFDITKGQGNGKNLFPITRFRYIGGPSSYILLSVGKKKKNSSLYRYIEVR